MIGRLGCRVDVDCGFGGSVDTGAVIAAVGAVAVLFVASVGIFVTDMFVAGVVPESQPASNRIIINPVRNIFINQNMSGGVLFSNGLLSL